MPSTQDIRRRIKSVQNTSQITRAMQLVAASKMKKAQDQALNGRDYVQLLNKVLVNLKDQNEGDIHPLLQMREGERELLVVISTDKGLCGALNTNLLRVVTETTASSKETSFITVGSKGRQVLSRLKKNLVADFQVKDPVAFSETKLISKFVTEQFIEGKYDRVRVAFTNFINTLKQTPHLETLLPISPIELGEKKDYEGMGEGNAAKEENSGEAIDYLFEPSAEKVFSEILPLYINFQLYQMTLEARASEHSARMVAMKTATDNAEEMIKDLKLEYNKIRQATITSELLEITTAMKALE